ncbi:MAG: hypothetical protein AAB859_00990, partial [Patescibacteria group bacterium]
MKTGWMRLYQLANLFIYIGEFVKKLIIYPILFIGNLLIKFIALIYIEIKKVKFKPIKLPALKLPTIKLPILKLPSYKLPKIKLNKNLISEKIKYFFLGCFITLIIVSIFQSFYFIKALPSPYNIGKTNYPLSTHIYDRNDTLLYEIYREQNRTPVHLKELPAYVVQATIAI